MNKFYRSLVAGLAVIGLVGCGDDITLEPPVPPQPTPITVTVAPDGVTIPVGGTVQMVAAVSGATGAAITWSTSSATVASVNATGLVTGVAVGSAGITATATAGGVTGAGSATITVSSTQTTPATISINGIINNAGTPVVLAAAAGQLNVQLNLERGGESIQRVELLLDNTVVGTQNFSLLATKAAGEEFDAIEVLTISFNSASFDATTGIADFLNGTHTLSAKVITAQNQQGTVSPSISLTLANTSFVAVNVEVGGANSATANDATGLLWQTGDLTATALPVVFTAGAPTVNQVVLTPAGLNPKTVTAAPFTATWAKGTSVATGGAGSGNTGIETAGLTVGATSTVGGATGPAGTSAAINFDTKAPSAPTFVANPVLRQNGWINATVGLVGQNGTSAFAGVPSATDNDWLANGPTADAGVGGYVRRLRVGTGGGTVANANGTASSDAPALPAPSVNNVTYCGVATAADLLGNESSVPAGTTACLAPPFAAFQNTLSQHLQFGVDVNAPTIAFSAGLASNARILAAAAGAEFQVTVADTGAVGNSGMLSGAAVIGNIMRRSAAATTCFLGTGASCAQTSVNAAPPFPLVPTTTVAAGALAPAYFTYTARAQDAAGNQTADVTRVVVVDNVAPTVSAPAVPVTITGAFSASAFINDDLSIRDYFWTAGFGGAATAPATITLASAPTVVDAFNSATLTNTNFAINQQINTFLELQLTGAADSIPAAYAAGAAPLNAVNLFARDQTSAYVGGTSAIAATAPAAGVSITNFTKYVITSSNATICAGTLPAGCAAVPTSTNLAAVATGTTAVFNNPFSRVDFYGSNGTDLVLLGSVSAGSATLVDNGATRVWTYTFNLTGSAAGAALGTGAARNIYAFGVNAAGNVALVSAVNSLTINP